MIQLNLMPFQKYLKINSRNSTDHEIMSEIIQYWFDNRIKTDGFDGNLSVNVKQIQFDREKKQDYYKFSISLSLEFIEKNPQQILKLIM